MSHVNLIRAWKDAGYLLSLSEAERALVPENPAGFIELADEEMNHVNGGIETGSQFGGTCYLN